MADRKPDIAKDLEEAARNTYASRSPEDEHSGHVVIPRSLFQRAVEALRKNAKQDA